MTAAIILIFIAVFLVVYAVFNAFMTSRESASAVLKRRLHRMARESSEDGIPESLRIEIIKQTPSLERLFARIPMLRNLERLVDHAGLKTTLANFLLFALAATVAGFAVAYAVTRLFPVAVLAALCVVLAGYIYLRAMQYKRVDKFTEQLPDALNMISRSLRAGHSLTNAVELVGEESAEPAKELFKTAYEQQKLGLRITDTLVNMSNRIDCIDLRYFTTAITINSEVGGNLSEILDKLAETIRERLKIKRQVRVYTAHGRLSGYVLAALPIITFFLLKVMMPGYVDVLLKEKPGNFMLVVAIVAQFIGFLVIKKIVTIKI